MVSVDTSDLRERGRKVTADELDAALAQACPHWTPDRWREFREASPEDQALALQMLEDAAEPPPADWTTKALSILEAAVSVAAGVSGIGGAISTIRGLIK